MVDEKKLKVDGRITRGMCLGWKPIHSTLEVLNKPDNL
jgi:hypothetical protein